MMVDAVARMRSAFKIPAFRRGQEQVIRSILAGRDVLAVMPTGSGKSLTYQLTSQVLPGTTLVVSPLLALIRDQTEKLRSLGIAVERIDSSLTGKERTAALARLAEGKTKLALVTPESAVSASFRNAMAGAQVSLFAVDEAHCVSQWGHDFRPAYLGLREVAESLGRPRLLALTATATPRVREDILAQLAKGADFAQLSASYSDAPNALQGGVIGWRRKARRRDHDRHVSGLRPPERAAPEPHPSPCVHPSHGGPFRADRPGRARASA